MSSRLMRAGLESGNFAERRIYPFLMTTFDRDLHVKILEFVERHERDAGARRIAIFDADGTLWRGDAGEEFFRYQLDHRLLPARGAKPGAFPKRDPWKKYWDEVSNGDPARAYGWLAQWNEGATVEEMSRWTTEFFRDRFCHAVFEPMRTLSHALRNSGFEVWVVSASFSWVIREGVKGYGVQEDHIIAADVEMKDGVFTGKLAHSVPYRKAKVELIRARIGADPLFAAGNTIWDKDMLQLAREFVLAVHSEKDGEPGFESEQKLRSFAEGKSASGARGVLWLSQGF